MYHREHRERREGMGADFQLSGGAGSSFVKVLGDGSRLIVRGLIVHGGGTLGS